MVERMEGKRVCEGSVDSSATSSHGFHQSWNLSAQISSEESSSDAEEMWVELQELRAR